MDRRAHRVPGLPRPLRLAVALPLLWLGGGCATAGAAWRSGPAGVSAEWALRDHLSFGRADAAWTSMRDKKIAPADVLLRHMYRGVISLHAGEFDAGTRSMDRAWTIAGDRYTKRLSAAAVSMVTSDAALPYDPGVTEMMFIPYYGGLNWLARNERVEAAVEARRLAALLASDAGPKPPVGLQGVLRYVSGVMFESAGERQDALVAYRNAAALLGTLPGDTLLAPPDAGDVVVIIEDGFVGRPEPRTLGVWMDGDELVALTTGKKNERYLVARTVAERRHDRTFHEPGFSRVGWLTYEVNWASFAAPSRGSIGVGARSAGVEFATVTADVTAAVQDDFEREQPARLARAIARAAIRYAAMEAADKAFESARKERKKNKEEGEKGGGWGRILLGIGLLATSVTSSAIDQPDLRAWQLLPDRITVARLRLPVGEHPIEVVRGGEVVSLGVVTVTPGGVAVLNHRWWSGALVQRASELPDNLPRRADVVDPGDRAPGLPVLSPRVRLHQ
ncbi:MAG: hypothetical protein WD771_07900 [Gemmatimonadaceae bacterium]